MINRTLLRIKVVQILYSFYKSGAGSLDRVEKELFFSLNKTYELYHLFFILILDIQKYAYNKIEHRKNKRLPSSEDLNPNLRFVENKWLVQLSNNKMLKKYIETTGVGWHDHDNVVKELYNGILQSDAYIAYMALDEVTYADDKRLWIQIVKHVFTCNELLGEILEELSIYWNDDAEVVLSFVEKTIKKFNETHGAEQQLLPLFKDDEDPVFAKQLLRNAILNADDYRKIIDQYAKNWDAERLAFMDMVIMQVALVELQEMNNIPTKVTLNEYIEISKYYSTEKSSIFINGILDSISKNNDIVSNLNKKE